MSEFWKEKSVLVTGHTGFKGSWLSLWLQQMGAKVTGLALAPDTSPSLFEVAKVEEGMTSVLGDIRDRDLVGRVFEQAQPEVVLHLAAQPLVRYSYDHPLETYETNVMGTANILDAARASPSVRSIVSVTSDKCYENKEWPWGYRENEAMGGYDPYSSSKGCAELVTASFRQSYFNPQEYERHSVGLASARAGNVIGGADWAEDRLVPDLVRAIEKGQPVVLRSPQAIRPWQHVLEPLSGYLVLAERLYDSPRCASAWNFGPRDLDAQPVEELVKKLVAAWGEGASYRVEKSDGPHEAHYLKLDCSKARQELNWTPCWDLDETVRRIAEWHKAHSAGQDMRAYSLQEISDYRKQKDNVYVSR